MTRDELLVAGSIPFKSFDFDCSESTYVHRVLVVRPAIGSGVSRADG